MTQVPLREGAYTARSVIAAAQRCVNLYPEANPSDEEAPSTCYPTPGLTVLSPGPAVAQVRGLYAASNGVLYAVVGRDTYSVDAGWNFTKLSNFAAQRLNTTVGPVVMQDNGVTLVIVDGSTGTPHPAGPYFGWTVVLATGLMAPIIDSNFFGANRVDYVDTFLLFNKPGTQDFYSSYSNSVTPFDPLYFAAKTAEPDMLSTLIVMHREFWLLGAGWSSEIWYNPGNPDFPFAITPGVMLEQGCAAPYSVAKDDLRIFWLGLNKNGQGIVYMGTKYEAQRISTHAIEVAIQSYATISDAIGMVYQIQGHTFYVLTFPTADHTWVFDATTGLWHEWVWIDGDGLEHRHRANCMALAYGKLVAGDWQNGNLYQIDINNYTDAGNPITRRRGFPHIVLDGKRIQYPRFQADMDCGNDDGSVDGTTPDNPPQVFMRYSNDGGHTWCNGIPRSMGAQGQYTIQPTWRRLGLARNRVFEMYWSTPAKTALNGAFIDAIPAET